MKFRKDIWLIALVAVLLSSCELLGIGGGDDKGKKKEQQLPKPELIWEMDALMQMVNPPPIIEDSSVYIAGKYSIARFSLINGEVLWSAEPESVVPRVLNFLADEENLYLRQGNALAAYGKKDGAFNWRTVFEDTLDIFDVSAGTSLTDQSNTKLFVGTREKLLIINKQDGIIEETIIPEVPVAGVSAERFNKPLISKTGDKVYLLTSYSINSFDSKGRIAAYSIADQSLLWQYDLPYILPRTPSPSLQMIEADGNLVILTGPAVIALDPETGGMEWIHIFYEGKTDVNAGSLLTYNDGYIYAVETTNVIKLDLANGQRIWKAPTEGLSERLLVSDGNIYVSTTMVMGSDIIYSIDAKTGDLNFKFTTSEGSTLGGLSSAFDASDKYLVDIGLFKVYAFQLPE